MQAQQKIYLTLIILVVVVIALLLFLVAPLVNKIKVLSADFKEKNNLLASYKEKGSDYLKKLRDEYADLGLKISEINESFVDPGKAIDFILAVEQAAALTNNYQEIREISLPEEENILSFQISLWGSFSNLIKFLTQLENMDYFVDSDSFQITRIEERDVKSLEDKGIVVSIGDVRSVLEIKVYTK